MMILLGVYTGWRAVHSEYYLHKGDDDAKTHTPPLPPPLLPTAHTPLLPPPPAPAQQQVEMNVGEGQTTPSKLQQPPPQPQPKHEHEGGGDRSMVKWLRGLKERMLATVVGTVHGVAGAFAPLFPFGVLGLGPGIVLTWVGTLSRRTPNTQHNPPPKKRPRWRAGGAARGGAARVGQGPALPFLLLPDLHRGDGRLRGAVGRDVLPARVSLSEKRD